MDPGLVEVRRAAYVAVQRALRDRKLIRPERCEDCGGHPRAPRGLYGHHHNGYDGEHQLDVVWLCETCHGRTHCGPSTWQNVSREKRSERMRAVAHVWHETSTPEQRSEAVRKAWANATPEERNQRAAKAAASLRAYNESTTREQRLEIARRVPAPVRSAAGRAGGAAHAAKSPEVRREIARKAAANRVANLRAAGKLKMRDPTPCGCGCGELTQGRFRRGHNLRVQSPVRRGQPRKKTT